MGRIIAPVTVANAMDPTKHLLCDALVDTGAAFMVLPSAWKERLGPFSADRSIELQTADQRTFQGTLCGPVRIKVEGFAAIFNEVLFVDMESGNGDYEPLVGYLVLEQCGAAVDMLGHRLVPVKYFDLK